MSNNNANELTSLSDTFDPAKRRQMPGAVSAPRAATISSVAGEAAVRSQQLWTRGKGDARGSGSV